MRVNIIIIVLVSIEYSNIINHTHTKLSIIFDYCLCKKAVSNINKRDINILLSLFNNRGSFEESNITI